MSRERSLLNHTYSINREEKLPSEIELYLNTSNGSIQYTFVFLSIARFLKQFLDEKSKEDCNRIVLFGNESNEYIISCFLKLGLSEIYPVSPFLYFVNPSKLIPTSSCYTLLICGGLYSDVYYVNKKERNLSNEVFSFSKDAIVNYFATRLTENYQTKYGDPIFDSPNLSECIESCCKDVVEKLQKGIEFPYIAIKHKNKQTKLMLSQNHLLECYRALCEEKLNAMIQQKPNYAIFIAGGGALFDALKQLASKYHLQVITEYSSLSEICENLEKYRLDVFSNGSGNLLSIRQFLGSLMPNYSSSAPNCWSEMDSPYPLSLLPSSIDSSVEKKPLRREEYDRKDFILYSVEQPKEPCDDSSSFGFFSDGSAYPLFTYSMKRDSDDLDGGWFGDCFVQYDERTVHRYLNKDNIYRITVESFGKYRKAFVVSSTLSNQSLVLRFDDCVERRTLYKELLDGVMVNRDPFQSVVECEEERVAIHLVTMSMNENEIGIGIENENEIGIVTENGNANGEKNGGSNSNEPAIVSECERKKESNSAPTNQTETTTSNDLQHTTQTIQENEQENKNEIKNEHENEIKNEIKNEIMPDSTSCSQSDPIDFLNEDSFDSNPIENEWIQYCVAAAINDEKCTSNEFEEWLASQDLENDPIYSILSHSDDTTVKPDSQDRSNELDCVAFHEYPLTENDLLSQHTQWRIIDDKIYDGDVLLYQGAISGDKLNGEGRWYYKNRTVLYNGFFSSNLWNGFGCVYYPNGTLFYKGDWKKGKMDGLGTLYKPINLQYCNAEQRKYIWDNERRDHLSIAKSYKNNFCSFKSCVCLTIPR